MEDETVITMLEDFSMDMMQREGWMLDKMFNDSVENTVNIYEKAVEYAQTLAAQFEVGIRPVTKKDSVFMEVYKKER